MDALEAAFGIEPAVEARGGEAVEQGAGTEFFFDETGSVEHTSPWLCNGVTNQVFKEPRKVSNNTLVVNKFT